MIFVKNKLLKRRNESMNSCDTCKWFWCGGASIYYCHEEDASRTGCCKNNGLDCPWYEEHSDRTIVEPEDMYGFWNGDPSSPDY